MTIKDTIEKRAAEEKEAAARAAEFRAAMDDLTDRTERPEARATVIREAAWYRTVGRKMSNLTALAYGEGKAPNACQRVWDIGGAVAENKPQPPGTDSWETAVKTMRLTKLHQHALFVLGRLQEQTVYEKCAAEMTSLMRRILKMDENGTSKLPPFNATTIIRQWSEAGFEDPSEYEDFPFAVVLKGEAPEAETAAVAA